MSGSRESLIRPESVHPQPITCQDTRSRSVRHRQSFVRTANTERYKWNQMSDFLEDRPLYNTHSRHHPYNSELGACLYELSIVLSLQDKVNLQSLQKEKKHPRERLTNCSPFDCRLLNEISRQQRSFMPLSARGGCVFARVCLSVCLLTESLKNNWTYRYCWGTVGRNPGTNRLDFEWPWPRAKVTRDQRSESLFANNFAENCRTESDKN